MVCPNGYILAVEGLAKICIPDPNLYRREDGLYEPSWAPVFYNPRMVENRDICVAVLRVELGRGRCTAVVDPLAATGVRGIRIVLEAGLPKGATVYMGDISPDAIEIMKRNIELNGVVEGVCVRHADANELMHQLAKREGVAISYIDIDPFGSPAPFTHTALDCVKRYGVVALTATDLAVLEGRYRDKLLRRYGVVGTRVLQSRDIALRVLLSFVMRIAAVYDKYIEPLLSYAMNHYARVYVRVSRGGTRAGEVLDSCLGAVRCCSRCGYYYMHRIEDTVDRAARCPVCEGKLEPIYPVWICPTSSSEYLAELVEIAKGMHWLRESSRLLLEGIYRTSMQNALTARLTYIAKAIKTDTPPVQSIIDCLIQKGFTAARSYTYSDGVVTSAPIDDVVECVRSRALGRSMDRS